MSIASQVKACFASFKLICDSLKLSTIPHFSALAEDFIDELGRLRVWAGNIAAHKSGQSSLDFRLRDASHLKEKVLTYLKDLNDSLQNAWEVLYSRPPTSYSQEFEESVDLEEADELSEAGSEKHDSEGPGLGDIRNEIAEIITCLMRLSMVIRKPAPHDHFTKSLDINTSFYESFDVNHVRSKFPLADEALVQRLGKAITKRRHYLKYRKTHAEKLAWGVDMDNDDDKATAIPESTVASSLPYDLRAIGVVVERITLDDALSETSQTSYATSAATEGRLRAPPLPEEGQGGKPFVCPLCHLLITASNTAAWKKHVYRDLCPYLCTFPECRAAQQAFESRHQWAAHEYDFHHRSWKCMHGCLTKLKSRADLENHLVKEHAAPNWDLQQLNSMIQMSVADESVLPSLTCQLCREEQPSLKKLQQHVGRHEEELSLFAIPSDVLEPAGNDDTSRSENDTDTEAVEEEVGRESVTVGAEQAASLQPETDLESHARGRSDDEEEDICPLCVEEFDLSDKYFKPCPCGYQICQFCYNNIKTNMNGLCPACRRPYDDKNVEWEPITPEEMAKYKVEITEKARKNARERVSPQENVADPLSRKHLAGLRVVQKNLVYVSGLSPLEEGDDLLSLLRGEKYFGQYGKIIKIVVSKAKDRTGMGIYVTFARKEDAETCIAALDGSLNGDRVIRAQYGTTKYCSAYLRGETCSNRNCMFLHEPAEENESFTRSDLSSLNAAYTQQPAEASGSSQSQQ